MTDGNSLTVQETVIANLPGAGIDVNAIAGTRVKIMDSVVRNNAGNGVYLRGGAIGDISNSKIVSNLYGVMVEGTGSGLTTAAAVNDTVVSGNYVGLYALAAVSGATARWTAIRTTASQNTFGFICTGNPGTASCTAGYSMASGNASAGFYNTGATSTFRSLGNNLVIDNGSNTVGTITPLAGT
jgi:hypothetical protein